MMEHDCMRCLFCRFVFRGNSWAPIQTLVVCDHCEPRLSKALVIPIVRRGQGMDKSMEKR